jgi:DNA-binding GntR family transcriptional regulator
LKGLIAVSINAEERAYRSILALVLSGEYKPGDFLLELDLAPKLKMSRTPVSRALARLVAEGFLVRMPKKGCYIPLPTPEDAEQVFFARMAVESQAAAAAAEHATEEEIRELRVLLPEDLRAVETREKTAFFSTNERFHLGIATISKNLYLEKWCRHIFWRSNVYVLYFDSFYRPQENMLPQKTPEQHKTIIDALEARDPQGAAQAMKDHIRYTYEKLLIKP